MLNRRPTELDVQAKPTKHIRKNDKTKCHKWPNHALGGGVEGEIGGSKEGDRQGSRKRGESVNDTVQGESVSGCYGDSEWGTTTTTTTTTTTITSRVNDYVVSHACKNIGLK